MSEYYELHRRAGDLLAETVKEIRDDQWHLPTPCSEWDVRDLAYHIAWNNLWVAPLCDGRNLAEVAPTVKGDVLGEDPIGVTLRTIEEASAGFERAGNETIVQLSRGPSEAWIYCGERMNDITVHNWDLARAIGVEVALDPECMERSLAYFRPYEALLRPAGELGPTVEVPEGAGLQTRYLAFFGRRADWTAP
ncbi:MAG: TIGR03086 family metal-binding protein [Actinomycetota bacterium]|nr:TIGR03086 family metal-binding protein [Actinomycetota bacterium]